MVIFYLNFKSKMHIIGLTGGIGSGKSEAAKIFSSLGAKIIDLDVIAHDLTAKNALGYSLIIEQFGHYFLNKKKKIDRKKLRKSIFEDKKIKIGDHFEINDILAEKIRKIPEIISVELS